MADKPNVTVIYQEAKASTPTFGAVLLELLVFLALAFVVGGGCS
jgi:hypothetical protein